MPDRSIPIFKHDGEGCCACYLAVSLLVLGVVMQVNDLLMARQLSNGILNENLVAKLDGSKLSGFIRVIDRIVAHHSAIFVPASCFMLDLLDL